jgi:hypothetical protein
MPKGINIFNYAPGITTYALSNGIIFRQVHVGWDNYRFKDGLKINVYCVCCRRQR